MTIWDVKMGQGRDMNNNISNRSVKIVSKAPKQHKKERKEDIFAIPSDCVWFHRARCKRKTSDTTETLYGKYADT